MKKIILFFLFCIGELCSQSLPNWFFKPAGIDSLSYCGIVETDYHRVSSFRAAFEKACKKAALYSGLEIKMNQSFISAIDKKYWTDFDSAVEFDTTLIPYFEKKFSVVDSFQTDEITVVLISGAKQHYDTTQLSGITADIPRWIDTIPKSGQYYYAVGQSIQYFHAVSSWDAAENSAVAELAREKYLKISSGLAKEKGNYSDSIAELQKEEVEASLKGIEIAERWIDKRNKIFYVLARMPKN
jgi:LPP20 lipoprotein